MSKTRRNFLLPDDLWTEVLKATAEEGARIGRPISATKWVIEALRQRLTAVPSGVSVDRTP